MMLKTLPGVLFLLSFFTSCNLVTKVPSSITSVSGMPEPVPARTPALPERIDSGLVTEIAKIAEAAGGKVGVGALLLETGDAVWLNGDERFVSQSVYKLPIAMAVMKMVDEGRLLIDQDITITPDDFVRRGFHSPIRNVNPTGTVMPLLEVVRYSISESDGTASDVLLDLAGGPAAVQSYLATFGISDFIVADSEKSISKDWETQYRNWATPRASIELLRALLERRSGLSETTTNILLAAMTDGSTGRRRIKSGIPPGASLAHKTGTGGRRTEVPGFRRAASESTDNASAKNSRTIANVRLAAESKPGSKNAGDARKNEQKLVNPDDITSATNDIGIITLPDGRHILIAVYVMDSAEDGWTRERVIADIAKAVTTAWNGARAAE